MQGIEAKHIIMPTAKIIGRTTSGSGPAEELNPTSIVPLLQLNGVISFIIDGGGSEIIAGQQVDIPDFPTDATITGWTITADQSGDAVVTISKASYANFPTFTDISGTEKPTLSSAQKNQDLSLSTWTTTLNQEDVLRASVDSAVAVTRLTITVRFTRT